MSQTDTLSGGNSRAASLSRRRFHFLCSGAALGAAFAALSDAAEPDPRSVFPYGTHVYREPSLPLEQLKADFPILKRLGFTMIKIQESWSMDEQKEGAIDLSRVEQVVSDARQNGLLVYFGVTMEQAPAWLWKKYPDARMVFESGQPFTDPSQYLLAGDGKPGPCWNHPGAKAAGIRFVEAVGRQIGKYDNIIVWNVFQEIGFDLPPGHLGFCYCSNTLNDFRGWLKSRYETLGNLNKCWRTGYGEWDEVEPPRRFTKTPSMMDWRYYMQDVYLAENLRWKAAAFRSSDPGKRRIMAHSPGPQYGSPVDWRWARELDVYGSSCYPGWSEYQDPGVSDEQRLEKPPVLTQMLDNALKWDFTRGASKNGEFWTAELQGGRAPGGIKPGRVPDPGDIRRWVMSALAGGVHGLCFWNHRIERLTDEAYGFGLLELAGDSTPRAEEAGRISRAIQSKAAELFRAGEVPRSQVAILLDENTWNFSVAMDEDLPGAYSSNIRGLHNALWLAGLQVDFVDVQDLREKGSAYKVLLLPFPISLEDTVLEDLRQYVRSGGTLLSGPVPGRFDRYAFGTAGWMPASASELFGVNHKQLIFLGGRKAHPSQNSYKAEDAPTVTLKGTGSMQGAAVSPEFYLEYLEPTTSTALLKFENETVAASNNFGKGRAILLGTLIGAGLTPENKTGNAAFLVRLLSDEGILFEKGSKLVRRERVLRDRAAWFFFNPTHSQIVQKVSAGNFRSATDLLGGTLPLSGGNLQITVPKMDVACILMA